MNLYSRNHDPAKLENPLDSSQQQWQNHLVKWLMAGILAFMSLGSLMPLASSAAEEIDIMVVYTPQAKDHAKDSANNVDINSFIQSLIKDTNDSYTASGVDQTLRLVHSEEVAYQGDQNELSVDDILDNLTSGTISNTEGKKVHDQRDRYLADVVILLVGNDAEGCGVAHQLDKDKNNPADFQDSAFAVARLGCAKSSKMGTNSYAFAHQLGHLMGCSDTQDKVGGKCTIMYQKAGLCFRKNEWANACATILNDTAKTVANFRAPNPGILQFSLASQSVNEDVGTVTLEVTRTEGKNGSVSVDVVISSGSATAGSDYTFTSPTTLTWADFDASPKTITVPIIDDGDIEAKLKEQVRFRLSKKTLTGGATVGQQINTVITITDNDGANTAYVIDVTGSMGFDDTYDSDKGELALATKSFTRYVQQLRDKIASGKINAAPFISFLTFRDEVFNLGISNDLTEIQDQIESLYVAVGGECPEASIEGLLEAAKTMRANGQIMLFTDAAPHPGLDIDATIAELKKKGLRVHVKLSGDCQDADIKRGNRNSTRSGHRLRDGSRGQNAKEIFAQIAFETSGTFTYIPEMNDGSIENGLKYENSIFNSMVGTDEPAVVDITPNTVPQGSTLDLTINAANTNFNDSSLVDLGSGIVVNEVEVISATQMIANVTLSSDLKPQFYDITVATSVGLETEKAEGQGSLQVITSTGEAELLSIAPATVLQNSTATVRLSGLSTSFNETSTIHFSTGIKTQKVIVQSPTLMIATIEVSSGAEVGLQNVFVETGSQSLAKNNAFLVLPSGENDGVSEITAISPAQGAIGKTLDISLLGQTTTFSEESVLEFSGNGIKVESLEVVSPTHALATISIDDDVTLGYRDVFISTGTETATLLNGFEIAIDVPEIIQVNPSYAFQDKTLDIEIIGRNVDFTADKNVVDLEGMGVSVLATSIDSSTQITANIQVDEAAKMGERNISVTTGSKVAVLRDGFEIFAKIAPVQLDLLEELAKANLYAVWGVIVDDGGNPIVGVVLQLGTQTATTDENGFWSIEGIAEGNYTAVATKEGYTFAPKDVTLDNQVFITEVTILGSGSSEKPDSYTAWGRIFNEIGNPIEGITVTVGEQTTTTDDTGQWEIGGLKAGKYTVIAEHKFYLLTSPEVTLGGIEARKKVKITLDYLGANDDYTVYGTITDADGNGLSDVTIKIGKQTAVTDANGKWEITGLSEGNYFVIASKDGFTFSQPDITLDQELTQEVKVESTVVLIGSYQASGTITDKFKGPMDGVTIQVYEKPRGEEPVATMVTDAAGAWKITTLFEGEYTVVASKDGYIFHPVDCFASENQACEPNLSNPDSILNLTVAAQPKTVKQGENVIYSVTVTNLSDQTATNIVVREELPENARLVSMGGNGNCAGMTCTLPDLGPGASANRTVVVSNAQVKTLKNTVTVTSEQFPADKETTRTKVLPYFSVSVSDQPEPVAMGGIVQYQVNVALSSKAPSAATGVELELLLPTGVELQAVSSDSAMCDVSTFPTITCLVADLAPANASSVNIDVELKDLGLLLLNLEASLSANEYPTHSVRERTYIDIPADIEVDMAFVIDVTGSMQEEIYDVGDALNQFIQAKIDANEAPLIALVTFKDNVTYSAFTRDMHVLRNAVSKLKAKGGGDCQEAAIEALKDIAIPHVKPGGSILFATDASPYADADIDGTVELLRSKGIRFNAMITGDCSKESSWNEFPTDSE
jgi:uncharacterized repeat protein (TIGR01451 family)